MGDWVLVPREPSEEMMLAASEYILCTPKPSMNMDELWRRMLASAPSPLEDEALVESLTQVAIVNSTGDVDNWGEIIRAIIAALGR